MKTLYKMRYLPLLIVPLLVVMMVLPATLVAYGPTVDLLNTSSFAVLATSVTRGEGTTIINGGAASGNVGYTGTITGTGPLTMDGGAEITGSAATTAMTDLVETVYLDAMSRTPTTVLPGTNALGGNKTLTSGVYSFTGGAYDLGAGETLTLDAEGDPNAVFIFKSDATLITSEGSTVRVINGGRFCRVFWAVPSSATLATNSVFVGHIFAMASITAMNGATVEGQLLAQTAVTLDRNTITNGPCDTIAAAGGILTIYKVDSSGNPIVASTPALSAAFNIYTNSADVGANPPYQAGSTIQDTNFFRVSLPNGTYYVAENSAPEGYNRDSTVRTVTMSGGDATLTFTNGSTGAAIEEEVTATTTPPVTVTTTVTSGQIPKTYTPWYNVLITGAALILIGAVGWWITRKVYV